MSSVVMKFGGTSVQDAAALRRLAAAVAAEARPRVLVVSALAGVTDALCAVADGQLRREAAVEMLHRLFERHAAIVRELLPPAAQHGPVERLRARFEEAVSTTAAADGRFEPRDRDALLAIGELASSELVAAVLAADGQAATWVDARRVIVTDDVFGHARPRPDAIRDAASRRLEPLLSAGRTAVLGGFIGAAETGATTTLGRGGSDYSAALLGAAIGADEIQIWTDVDGVLTADPRVVDNPVLVPELSFHEAYELARFGAKVLHWGTLEPAASDDIPVRVLNSRRPSAGTTISARPVRGLPVVVGIAHRTGITVADLRARGVTGSLRFLQTALDWVTREGHGCTVVSLSAVRFVVIVPDAAMDRLSAAVEDVGSTHVWRDAGLVAVVGDSVAGHAPVWSAVTAAARAGEIESVVSAHSGAALVCVTPTSVTARVVATLHETFFGRASNRVNPAVVAGPQAAREWELTL